MPSIWANFDQVFEVFRASFSPSSYGKKMALGTRLGVPKGLLISANAKINIRNLLISENLKEDLQSLVNTDIPLY